ncbi:sugar MFS transporter [Dyadobacter frigoris]|uniref:Sugar MFS transporter n=1 Tax=Dyadobacter frigoris TaxID=2576211 RepID=A0A4U6CV19_9BACT|nr:sugar MFS transporter [Dyadobacter frigoris]TKT87585.1 sugar MFS transporter [Dyadobacter frigoris]GLU52644.1 sugar transporter [Dyadobacter frigoris]
MAAIPVNTVSIAEPLGQKKQNYTPALLALAVLYFMMGFITCLNDTLVPFFKKGFTLTYSQSSLVQFYFFLTYGIASIPAGKVVEKVGYKKGMVLGFSIAAFGALLFFPASVAHQYALFLAALFIVAIGIVLLQVAANPYITILGPAKTASSRLTLIQGVGSMGTTTAPLFGAYYILAPLQNSAASSDAVKYPYLGIAAALILIALIVSRLSLPVLKSADQMVHVDKESAKGIFSFRNLNFGIIGLFVYVGAEVSIGTFLTNYTADLLKISESAANTYVAFYWGGMLAGRLIGSALLKSLKASHVLSVCAAGSVFLILLSVNTSGLLAVWSMVAVGLCNSIMFAIIFSLAVNGLGKYTTQASGLLSTAIAGGALISFCQGLLIDHATWKIAFMLPLACYVYILFYGLHGYKSKFSTL